ncbi:MAG: methanogenesis marker 2 protein, partial [Methanohalobium sp.]|uniref:methanogenesis marker 2 protein n=1 Tax=Methanohalobium sp. TaxID=2837493 RepID=UPI00397D0987
MDLKQIADSIRNFEGVTRKKPIEGIVEIFESVRSEYGGSLVDFGDDAAVIDIGRNDVILFAADSIWEKLMRASPWWAGYTAILANVNDIAAMGARPLAMVDVISSSDKESCDHLLKGITDGIRKFGVPMVGGHLHPDTPYSSIAVAIIGIAKKDCIIRSDTAKPGDSIIVAYDMDGRIGPNSPYSWDTTSFKDSDTVRDRCLVMQTIGERKLATAGKDISNPGTIGTLGMLCETSNVGASVDLEKIPVPEGVELEQWLKVYTATGYVITVRPENADECIQVFSDAGIKATVVGEINGTLKLDICGKTGQETVFDFEVDEITGITKVGQ